MLHENCYVAYDEPSREAAIIDPGFYWDEEKRRLERFVQEHDLQVKYLLCTHLHFDHIFGNPFVEKELGVKSLSNDKDWPWAETIAERVARFGLRYTEKIPAIGRVLSDGDEIKFGNSTIKAIHVPGHSPGSLAYYVEKENILFSGDALFQGSIGRTDFADSDYATLIDSIKSKLLALPDATRVFPGHGDSTTIAFEKQYNRFLL
jgi:glyoxylase-like metal-dependent hydrolase (beta-lactamase superfamily II)